MEIIASIIIPVYNAEKYIHKCMKNVLKQTCENIEIIMIDDGSIDSSGIICDDYAQKDNRVKVIHQDNSGVSNARNAGIKYARGKYIVFLDADDEIDEYLIEDNCKILEDSNADFLFFCFRYFFPGREEIVHNEFDEVFCGSAEEFFQEELIKIIDKELMHAPWNKMIRKQFLQKNNIMFDTRYSIYEDITFSIKMCSAAEKICINRKEYYTYNIWTQGTLRTKFWENNFEAATEMYNNAIAYCSKYENNARQMARFNLLYAGVVINYIKNVCLNNLLSETKKKQIVEKICNDNTFRNALKNTVFQGTRLNRIKKKIISRLILSKKTRLIILSYVRMDGKKLDRKLTSE